MSELRANTLSDAAGTGPATLTGQSAAKAWGACNSAGTEQYAGTFNVSSITDSGSNGKDFSLTNSFTTIPLFAIGRQGISAWSHSTGFINYGTANVTSSNVSARYYSSSYDDSDGSFIAWGDLA